MKNLACLLLACAVACDAASRTDAKDSGVHRDARSGDNADADTGADGAASDEPSIPLFGIAAVAKDWASDEASYDHLFDTAKPQSVYQYSLGWSGTERVPHEYDFSELEGSISALRRSGASLVVADINTPLFFDSPDLPGDLAFVSYTDATLVQRYFAFVEAVLVKLDGPAYVVLHTEGAGSAFSDAPQGFQEFCQLVGDTADYIRGQFPGTQVSNYNTDYESQAVSECLNRRMDWWATGLVLASPWPQAASDIRTRLDMERKKAAGKRIGLIEVNYGTSPTLGDDPEGNQSRFVDALFNYLEEDPGAFAFVNWYGLFDETPEITRAWVTAQFGDKGDDFINAMIAQWSNQGLWTVDDRPKPAWDVWVARTQAFDR